MLMKTKTWLLLLGGVVLIIIGSVLVYLLTRDVPVDDPVAAATEEGPEAEATMGFPGLRGTNLIDFEGVVNVPADLGGLQKLIVVAYDVEQQADVEAWLEPLEELNADFPDLRGYYVPLLPKDTADRAGFILGGMSAVAGSNENRERTIVVFTSVEKFNELLEIASTDTIQLFLLDEKNRIIWRATGAYNAALLDELREALSDINAS